MTAYADGRGYVMIDQFTPADADQFYAGLKLGPTSAGNKSVNLRVGGHLRQTLGHAWTPL